MSRTSGSPKVPLNHFFKFNPADIAPAAFAVKYGYLNLRCRGHSFSRLSSRSALALRAREKSLCRRAYHHINTR